MEEITSENTSIKKTAKIIEKSKFYNIKLVAVFYESVCIP